MSRSGNSRNPKRVQPAKKIERQGIALISRVVADMGHLWNEPQNDFGTDGSIELVDPQTEKASNRIVLVQSKATSVAFGERPIGFTCEEDDLRYWLRGNAPVVLIRSHPGSDEAYWVSVKDYFKEHPEQRASRRIIFDRERDRFDASCSQALWELARPRIDGLHLGTPPLREALVMNLLPVASFPDTIYVADSTIQRQSEARAAWGSSAGAWPRDWVLWSGKIYSFSDPDAGLLSSLCSGPVTSFPAADWAHTEADDHRRRFVWLLKAALSGQMRPALRSSRELTWVAAADELPVVIDIPDRSTTRTIVKQYLRDDGSVRYVRHLAFIPAFVLYGEQWYLELTPSYHFTRDGHEPDFYAASHRSGIKRIERHSDFRRNVDTLARILRGDVDLGGLTPDPAEQLLRFGELAEATVDTSDDRLERADVELDDDEDESPEDIDGRSIA
ncbi:MAG: DUF4365 domain-containing protein [Solirubrobacteraceae bacterium]